MLALCVFNVFKEYARPKPLYIAELDLMDLIGPIGGPAFSSQTLIGENGTFFLKRGVILAQLRSYFGPSEV